MPRYHFMTDDSKTSGAEEVHHEFSDDRAASDAAQRALADMAQDALPDGAAVDLTAKVDNECGDRVYEASLKFRGRTASAMRADEALEDADADAAAKEVSRALDGIGPPTS